jgi:hypothetical protein
MRSQGEVLEDLNNRVSKAEGSDLLSLAEELVAWGLKRHNILPPHPHICVTEKLIVDDTEQIAVFYSKNTDGNPEICVSFKHPTVQGNPTEFLLAIFHEKHHFIGWSKGDPYELNGAKGGPTHPKEIQHTEEALSDLAAFLKEKAEQ